MSGNVWNQVLSRIETKVNRHSFYTWFRPTTLLEDSGEQITIRVPNGLFRDWLTKHYAGIIGEATGALQRQGTKIAFVTENPSPSKTAPDTASAGNTPSPQSHNVARLNPRYTFDRFIVGPSNQFAHAAARAVALWRSQLQGTRQAACEATAAAG